MEQPGQTSVGRTRPRPILTERGEIVRAPLIDDPELEAMRTANRERQAALHPFNEAGRRRLWIYVLGACVSFPLANFVLISASFRGLWVQLLVAIVYGIYVALARPGILLCALATLGAGMIIASYLGTSGAFHTLLALILYGTAGALLGFRENDRQLDR